MGYLGKRPATQGKDAGPALKLDDISSDFNGLTTVFELTVNGTAVDPHINNIQVYLGGVHQIPGSSFSLSGSQIVFTGAPSSSLGFHGNVIGDSRLFIPDNDTVEPASFTANTRTHISGSFISGFNYSGTISGSSTSTASFGRLEVAGNTNLTGDIEFDDVTATGNIISTGTNKVISGSITSTGSFGRLQIDSTASFGRVITSTADINGGTIDGITSLTAGGDLDIGAHDLRASTLTADSLTATRVPFAGTDGVLSDDSDLTFATATLSATNLTSTGTIKDFGLVSGSSVSTGSVGRLVVGDNIDLVEDQKIHFEADKLTYVESHASDSLRAVVNNRQMFLLDEDTGNRAVFGNETKVFIGANNNQQPTSELEVDGTISGSTDLYIGDNTTYVSASGGNIFATGNISGSATSTGSFGRLQTQQANALIGGNVVTIGGALTTAGTLTTQNNNVTINAVGAARTLTLNESLTVGDGHDGTITFGAASKTLTVENTSLLNQDLTTDASPTFAGATITGTLTVQEIHTEFESASILFTSGSTQFGNSTDDVHNVTGSMKITGSFQVDNGTLTAGTVDINGGTINGITDLAVADGGTGVSTLTDGGVLLGSGTSGITAMSVLADSEMIVGNGSTDPVAESGATLRTSIGVGTTDDVKFANITGSNNISASGNLSITGNVDVDGTSNFAGAVTLNDSLDLQDNDKILIGTGDDLEIFFDGTNSQIHHTPGSGQMFISSDQIAFDDSQGTPKNYATFYQGTGTVFNEDGENHDFRVESSGNANMLVVDANVNRVGIGVATPGSPLDVESSEAANTANFNSTNGATNITLESNGSLIGQMEFSGPGPSQIVTRTSASLALGSNNVKSVFITDDDRVGIGNSSPSHLLHVNAADGASDNTQAMTIENNETTDGRSYGLKIKAGSNASDAPLFVQDHDASNDFFIIRGNGATGVGTTAPSNKFVVSNGGAGGIEFNPGDSTSSMVVFNRGTSSYISYLVEAGKITFAPQGTNPVVIDQGANDGEALSLKSSDVSHPQTNTTEADTYGRMLKASSTGGGLRIDGFNDANNIAVEMVGNAQGDSQGRATDTNGPIVLRGVKTSGNDPGDLPSNSNILVVANRNTVRFIFDSDGDFHADNSSTTFDQYNDSQLVRAFDLSHGRGVIQSKFDDFVNYQHETLASLKLVGREKDGTPNNFVNVTGMQRLHNGAIWQQYTEMEKMKELMYDTMVELIGKEQADKKLEKHDIKLLDESLDVTDSLWSRTKNKVKSLFKVVKD